MKNVTLRNGLIAGQYICGVLMLLIGFFAYEENSTILILLICCFVGAFQATIGPMQFTYVAIVANSTQITLANMVVWFGVLTISLATNWMFDTFN